MRENWDNLKPGKWIVCVAFNHPTKKNVRFDGMPICIIAKDFPFIVCDSLGKRFTVDFRDFQVKIVHRRYVDAWMGGTEIIVATTEAERCVVCGDIMEPDRCNQGHAHWYCKRCKRMGEVVR